MATSPKKKLKKLKELLGLLDQGDFTARDIARRIARTVDADEVTRTVRRISRWSSPEQALLEPVHVGAGSGDYHRYNENAVYKAAMLLEMNRLDLPLEVMRYVLDVLGTGSSTDLDGKQIEAGTIPNLTQVIAGVTGDLFWDGQLATFYMTITDAHALRRWARNEELDLKKIYDNVSFGPPHLEETTSALVINVSQVLRGVRSN